MCKAFPIAVIRNESDIKLEYTAVNGMVILRLSYAYATWTTEHIQMTLRKGRRSFVNRAMDLLFLCEGMC